MFRSSTGLAILDIAFWTNEAKVIKTVIQHAPTNCPEIPRMRNTNQNNGKFEFALWEREIQAFPHLTHLPRAAR